MNIVFRIAGVWLVSLGIASMLMGGSKNFLVIFVTYGFFMTLPALAILSIVAIIEGIAVIQGYLIASRAVGPIIGFAVPVFLYLVAPNKSNAIMGVAMLAPITIGTGILWTASYLLFPRRSRLHRGEE